MISEVSRAGYGKPGYCKLCSWVKFPELQSRIQAGWRAPALQAWAEQFNFRFDRKALYRHNEHAKAPADKLVAASAKARAPQTRSNKEVLEAIRDIGIANAEADPSLVTVNHALKALQIMENKGQGQTNVLVLLTQAMTAQLPSSVIEGEATEL